MPHADPRLRLLADTVNGYIKDRAIRHALYLERLKSHHAAWIIEALNRDVFPDLLRKVNGDVATLLGYSGVLPETYTMRRLREMTEGTLQVMRSGLRTVRNGFSQELRDLALSEAEWQAAVFRKAVPSVLGIDFVTPSPRLLASIPTSRPFEGRLMRDWFSRLATSTRDNLNKAIRVGLIEGEGIPKIMRRIRGTKAANFADGILQTTRHNAEDIARTSVAQVANHAAMETAQANADVIKEWQFTATLCDATCLQCAMLDGETFPLGEGGGSEPPIHWKCKCRVNFITKSWDELGIEGLKEMPPGTRASMGGEVPSKLTYRDWIKQQPKAVQVEALGKGRAEIFRRGKLKIDRFVSKKGERLTLKELLELEALLN